MSDTIEIKDKGLKQLIKAFKAKLPTTRVGVVGDKDQRADTNQNAKIGTIHEYGSGNMPARSFLRIPITENLEKYLSKSGAFGEETLKKVISEASLKAWMVKMGIVAESIVQDAFDTGGFGKWPASNMKYKNVKMTLVETTQLRKSIGSEVND